MDNWPYDNKISTIDEYRINLINTMSDDEKDLFALGMGLYSALITQGQVNMGAKNMSEMDLKNLKTITSILKLRGFPLYEGMEEE